MDSLGLYIHIPFCDGKCNYCDFYSFKADEVKLDEYTDILVAQILSWSKKLLDKYVDTIYFGGGTPSLLGTARLVKVIKAIDNSFKIASDCEITIEANPTSAELLDFAELKKEGVNRVSLGMQSAIDSELKLLGRRHLKKDVINSVKNIKNSGIDNISIDVMLGIPEQTEESLKETLGFCISLNVPHISTYMLTVEPETVFGRFSDSNDFADDDTQAKFYMLTSDFLAQNGYTHYEISNFCKDNKFSRHNMRYWQLRDYLGLGPSAHSMIDGKRFYYPKSIDDFRNDKFVDDGIGRTKDEYIMLMLRTDSGVDFDKYYQMFGEKIPDEFIRKAQMYQKYGYIKVDDNSVRLTEKGFLLSNTIIAELI